MGRETTRLALICGILMIVGVVFSASLWAAVATGGPDGGAPSQESARDKVTDLQHVRLGLSVSIKRADGASSFVQGEPAIIQVLLTNKTAEDDYLDFQKREKNQQAASIRAGKDTQFGRYNAPEELILKLPEQDCGWGALVKLKLIRKASTGGEDEWIWQDKDWRLLMVSHRKQVGAKIAVAERPILAVWRLRSELSRELAAGRYEIVAHYDTTSLEGDRVPRGDLVASAEFQVLEATEERRDERFLTEMAKSSLGDGDPDEAIRYSKLVIAKKPDFGDYEAYVCLGQAYERKGMLLEAITAYEEFVRHNSDVRTQRGDLPIRIAMKCEMLRQKLRQDDKSVRHSQDQAP